MSDAMIIPGSTGGQSKLGRFIDHNETYGPHVLENFFSRLNSVATLVDLGAGSGRDLRIAKKFFPSAKTIAIENHPEYVKKLTDIDQVFPVNLERDMLPFQDESIDLILANQVLEHTKEIFWIFHEVTRSLKLGGHFIIGVPNIASFHNRLLLLLGHQPTQHKLYSAHVRPFSKQDTINFTEVCFPGGYELVQFAGSQFYPLPKSLARAAAKLAPGMAFSIFFLFKKVKPYTTQFLDHPVKAQLETNFFLGGRSA